MDCESIERRDFPTVRRGYDQAAVDAHLRAVATEVQEFARRTEGAGGHALVAEPEVGDQRGSLRPGDEQGLGPLVDGDAADLGYGQLAA